MARVPTVFSASRRSRLEGLVALRDRLSKAIDEGEPNVISPLASRHMEVCALIEELQAKKQPVDVEAPKKAKDEIAARRASRAQARKAS